MMKYFFLILFCAGCASTHETKMLDDKIQQLEATIADLEEKLMELDVKLDYFINDTD